MDKARVIAAIPRLKALNLGGNDIYIRPHSDTSLILLDDLNGEAIKRLESDGLRPAVLTQTSPWNWQAWLRLSDAPLDRATRKAAARHLAVTYGADQASADGHHYGRLAGFTNRKPRHVDDMGRYPWVLLERSNGLVAANGQTILEAVAQQAAAQPQLSPIPQAIQNAGPVPVGMDDFAAWYAEVLNFFILERVVVDYNRVDWAVTSVALRNGVTYDVLASAFLMHSPMIADRKAGHINDYMLRTYWKQVAWKQLAPQQSYSAVRDQLLGMAKALAGVPKNEGFAKN
jgi:hypothetical protein